MPFTQKIPFGWQLRSRTLSLGLRTVIMGILNVTPDSFSDGGHFYSPSHEIDRAMAQALHMLEDGAQILDIGGESTRPNAAALTADEEQTRILPVIAAILRERPHAILSVDTYHASTARHAIDAGAEIVNDVSGHLWDPDMSETCSQLACGVVLMHTRGRPAEWRAQPPIPPNEVTPLVLAELHARLEVATAAGIAPNRIVLDPGLGFGKRGSENYALLAHLEQLAQLHHPILIGASRKGFLRHTIEALALQAPDAVNPAPTTAANVAAILAGAHILRVHDVRPAAEAAAIADAIQSAGSIRT
jgi:dihydropteroate synthase